MSANDEQFNICILVIYKFDMVIIDQWTFLKIQFSMKYYKHMYVNKADFVYSLLMAEIFNLGLSRDYYS